MSGLVVAGSLRRNSSMCASEETKACCRPCGPMSDESRGGSTKARDGPWNEEGHYVMTLDPREGSEKTRDASDESELISVGSGHKLRPAVWAGLGTLD